MARRFAALDSPRIQADSPFGCKSATDHAQNRPDDEAEQGSGSRGEVDVYAKGRSASLEEPGQRRTVT